jgi:hypothetical protein
MKAWHFKSVPTLALARIDPASPPSLPAVGCESLSSHSVSIKRAPCCRSCAAVGLSPHALSTCRVLRRTVKMHHCGKVAASSSVDDAQSQASAPVFELRCLTAAGERTLQDVESGDLLRDAMLSADPPVELYGLWGKVANCSGSGTYTTYEWHTSMPYQQSSTSEALSQYFHDR